MILLSRLFGTHSHITISSADERHQRAAQQAPSWGSAFRSFFAKLGR